MKSLKDMKIRTKIIMGFFVVICLFLVVAVVGYRGLEHAGDDFDSYQDMTRTANLAAHLEDEMLMVHMNVKDFIITGSQEYIDQYRDRIIKVESLLEESRQGIQSPKRAALIQEVDTIVHDYMAAFDQVVSLRAKRDDILYNTLTPAGVKMRQALTELVDSAFVDKDPFVAIYAGRAQERLLLGRLYAAKFLDLNDKSASERAIRELEGPMQENLDVLDLEVQNPKYKELVNTVENSHEFYIATFKELAGLINIQNDVIRNQLDKIGPRITRLLEDVKLSVKTDQEELGGQVVKDIVKEESQMVMVSLVAIVAGLFSAFWISLRISRPVTTLVGKMEEISSGNFDVEITTDSEDEMGLLSKGMAHMCDELKKSGKVLKETVHSVASAAEELSASSKEMRNNAVETTSRAHTVQKISTETNNDVESVAAAAEELSVTVKEISNNVQEAREIRSKAALMADAVKGTVEKLDSSSSEIGKIVTAINSIAGQTNLLALNATIEAGRAGEAGRGFAVVAHEVKGLAKGTSESTKQIQQQIQDIQSNAREVVSAIREMIDIFHQNNEISLGISSAIEQQTQATLEISETMARAASSTKVVNQNISDIMEGTEVTSSSADDIMSASQGLSEISSQLSDMVKAHSKEDEESSENKEGNSSEISIG